MEATSCSVTLHHVCTLGWTTGKRGGGGAWANKVTEKKPTHLRNVVGIPTWHGINVLQTTWCAGKAESEQHTPK